MSGLGRKKVLVRVDKAVHRAILQGMTTPWFGRETPAEAEAERVTFTEREWDIMLSDPSFGYVCANGHAMTDGDRYYGACLTCEAEAEAAWGDYMDEQELIDRSEEDRMAAADSEAEFRAIQAGNRYEAAMEAQWERYVEDEPF